MSPAGSARLKTRSRSRLRAEPPAIEFRPSVEPGGSRAENGARSKRRRLGLDAKMKSSPLEVGGERIIPSVTRVFTDQQTLYVFFQAYLPQKADASALRAGLVFFRNGQRLSDTPMVAPAEYDEKTRTASFRISLPLAGSERRPLHGTSHRGRCRRPLCGVWPGIISRFARSKPAAALAPQSPSSN